MQMRSLSESADEHKHIIHPWVMRSRQKKEPLSKSQGKCTVKSNFFLPYFKGIVPPSFYIFAESMKKTQIKRAPSLYLCIKSAKACRLVSVKTGNQELDGTCEKQRNKSLKLFNTYLIYNYSAQNTALLQHVTWRFYGGLWFYGGFCHLLN